MRRVIILGLFLCLGLLLVPAVAVAHDPISHLWEAIGEIRTTLTSLDARVTALETGAAVPTPEPTPEGTYRGMVIAAEDRCTEYDRDDYSYPQSVEADIVAGMGGIIYSPYTGEYFDSTDETDIEHIIATSEAHDSGMCDATDDEKDAFARDLLNLTLAAPTLNRHEKAAKDAAEWLPDENQCWFANTIVKVRVKYGLTVDQTEADALEDVLEDCESVDMIILPRAGATPEPTATPVPITIVDPTPVPTPSPDDWADAPATIGDWELLIGPNGVFPNAPGTRELVYILDASPVSAETASTGVGNVSVYFSWDGGSEVNVDWMAPTSGRHSVFPRDDDAEEDFLDDLEAHDSLDVRITGFVNSHSYDLSFDVTDAAEVIGWVEAACTEPSGSSGSSAPLSSGQGVTPLAHEEFVEFSTLFMDCVDLRDSDLGLILSPFISVFIDALALYDDNGNGRISCAEARAHGIAPVHEGHPAYEFMDDRDGDGVVCE